MKYLGNNDELNSKIRELQDLNKTKLEEYESNLALTNNGVKNNKALKALLDLDAIKMDFGLFIYTNIFISVFA